MMRLYKVLLVVIVGLLVFTPVAAQEAAQAGDEIDAFIQKLADDEIFSGAALVAQGDEVLLSKGYGLANREWDVANTAQTKFRIGSITKQFTGAAILLLQEQGKLTVEDKICQYIKDCPESWQPITIHHLLTHTAGIPNITSFPDFVNIMRLPLSPDKLIATFSDKPLDFEAGERWSYSNSGYIVLGKIIEVTSGGLYNRFLRTNILEAAGMADSGYDYTGDVIKNRAQGYETTRRNAAYIDMSLPYAAGALYSTVEDLHRWNRALHNGDLLKPESYALMVSETVAVPEIGEDSLYGYGVIVDVLEGQKAILHGGGINGFVSVLVYLPDDEITVVVLSNLESAPIEQIMRSSVKMMVAGEQ